MSAGEPCPSCGKLRFVRRCAICKRKRTLRAFAPKDAYCHDCRRVYRRRYYRTVTLPLKRKLRAEAADAA